MYIPEHFRISEQQQVLEFIASNAFGQLVSTVEGRLFATPMPFLLSDDGSYLHGHIARENPQAAGIEAGEVLVSFLGPHHYISPRWYTRPGVPTWNYQAVHVYGHCTTFSDPQRLKVLVDALTAVHEAPAPEPWQPEYPDAMLSSIVGIDVRITELQGKFKLSQNRTSRDRESVIAQLSSAGAHPLAEAMASQAKTD